MDSINNCSCARVRLIRANLLRRSGVSRLAYSDEKSAASRFDGSGTTSMASTFRADAMLPVGSRLHVVIPDIAYSVRDRARADEEHCL